MPQIEVIYYKELNGNSPVRQWLDDLLRNDRLAFVKCQAGINLLAKQGHAARRPLVDMLIGGIYELRVKKGRVNYRILYFFHGRAAAVLTGACTKEAEVPPIEISRASERRDMFLQDPERHTHREVQPEITEMETEVNDTDI